MDDEQVQEIRNYRKLSERIATAGQPSEQELEAVARAGYQVVVNLGLHDGPYALADEEGLVKALGLEYVHIPVVWERPTRADIQRFFETIDAHLDRNMFVHCAANKRVSVFMALHRILRLGWSAERALEDVYAIWLPNDVWQAFIDGVLSDYTAPAG